MFNNSDNNDTRWEVFCVSSPNLSGIKFVVSCVAYVTLTWMVAATSE